MARHKSNPGVFLSLRSISIIISGILLLFFLFFTSGYFWGQKKAAEYFCYRVDQESLADQIYSSLCTFYDVRAQDDTGETEAESSSDINTAISTQPEQKDNTRVQPSAQPEITSAQHPSTAEPAQKQMSYCAALIGYGNKKSAIDFQNRLAKRGIDVIIKEQESNNKRGKKIVWYQVVTQPMTDQQEFMKLVDHIKRIERIKDVRFITS
jgi:hypothetical protein